MLVISLITIAQFSQNDQLNINKLNINPTEPHENQIVFEVLEEEDAPFDFNTKDYLPMGFDAYQPIRTNEFFEVSEEELDEDFDFNRQLYLPKGFDPHKGMKYKSEIANL